MSSFNEMAMRQKTAARQKNLQFFQQLQATPHP
jgi:hypothetical protein